MNSTHRRAHYPSRPFIDLDPVMLCATLLIGVLLAAVIGPLVV